MKNKMLVRLLVPLVIVLVIIVVVLLASRASSPTPDPTKQAIAATTSLPTATIIQPTATVPQPPTTIPPTATATQPAITPSVTPNSSTPALTTPAATTVPATTKPGIVLPGLDTPTPSPTATLSPEEATIKDLDSKAKTPKTISAEKDIKVVTPPPSKSDDPQVDALTSAVANFKIEATFYNPAGLKQGWDYGFKFRTVNAKNYLQFRFRLTSDKKAFLILSDASTFIPQDSSLGTKDATTTSPGASLNPGEVVGECDLSKTDFNTDVGGQNKIDFYVFKTDAYLVVNDKFAHAFDVSKLLEAGSIQLVSGFYNELRDPDGKATTVVKDIKVWDLGS